MKKELNNFRKVYSVVYQTRESREKNRWLVFDVGCCQIEDLIIAKEHYEEAKQRLEADKRRITSGKETIKQVDCIDGFGGVDIVVPAGEQAWDVVAVAIKSRYVSNWMCEEFND